MAMKNSNGQSKRRCFICLLIVGIFWELERISYGVIREVNGFHFLPKSSGRKITSLANHRNFNTQSLFVPRWSQETYLFSSGTDDNDVATTKPVREVSDQGDKNDDDELVTISPATVGTVNERLLAELQEAAALEKSGRSSQSSSSSSKKNRLTEVTSYFKSSKTDAERRAAIAEAQNLNGVNPLSTLFGALFALACSVGLWIGTQALVTYFALHPPDSDIYFVERVTLVSRNVVMGLAALASGFFGVTGIGILLLAIRVGYGVITGELDPTPISPTTNNQLNSIDDSSVKVDMSNVWDFMTNKPPKKGPR